MPIIGKPIEVSSAKDLAYKLYALDPPTSSHSSDWTKRQLERRRLSSAISSLPGEHRMLFPCVLIEQESPDFVLASSGYRRLGIEITSILDPNINRNFSILDRKAKSEGRTEWHVTIMGSEPSLTNSRNDSFDGLKAKLENRPPEAPISGYSLESAWIEGLQTCVKEKSEKISKYDASIVRRWLVVGTGSAWGWPDRLNANWDELLTRLRCELPGLCSNVGFERIIVLLGEWRCLDITTDAIHEPVRTNPWKGFMSHLE